MVLGCTELGYAENGVHRDQCLWCYQCEQGLRHTGIQGAQRLGVTVYWGAQGLRVPYGLGSSTETPNFGSKKVVSACKKLLAWRLWGERRPPVVRFGVGPN